MPLSAGTFWFRSPALTACAARGQAAQRAGDLPRQQRRRPPRPAIRPPAAAPAKLPDACSRRAARPAGSGRGQVNDPATLPSAVEDRARRRTARRRLPARGRPAGWRWRAGPCMAWAISGALEQLGGRDEPAAFSARRAAPGRRRSPAGSGRSITTAPWSLEQAGVDAGHDIRCLRIGLRRPGSQWSGWPCSAAAISLAWASRLSRWVSRYSRSTASQASGAPIPCRAADHGQVGQSAGGVRSAGWTSPCPSIQNSVAQPAHRFDPIGLGPAARSLARRRLTALSTARVSPAKS